MNVGNYVRTKYGIIARITDIIEDLSIDCDKDVYYENDLRDKMPMMEIPYNLKDEYIVKSSPNIIDLIEVGDYVNGCKIIELATNIEGKVLYLETDITEFDNMYACGNINIYEKDIRTIVTKECFKSMEYKVKE